MWAGSKLLETNIVYAAGCPEVANEELADFCKALSNWPTCTLSLQAAPFVSIWKREIPMPPEESMQKLINLLKLTRQAVMLAMVEDYLAETEISQNLDC